MSAKHPHPPKAAPSHDAHFLRLPGVFRRWEIEQVIEIGHEFVIDDAGAAADGTRLYAVFFRSAERVG